MRRGIPAGEELTRRALIQKAGVGAFALSSASLLAACGGGSSSTASSVPKQLPPKEVGRKLRSILGTPTGEAALAGEILDLGVAVASKGEEEEGTSQYRGIELAKTHIEDAGGPELFIHTKDLSAFPGAGAEAGHVYGTVHVAVCFTSRHADNGTMLHAADRFNLLVLDGGDGTGPLFQGRPYFYGTVASRPEDLFGGAFECMKRRVDKHGSTSLVTLKTSPAQLAGLRASYESSAGRAGVPIEGFATVTSGQADYGETIAALRQQNPSVVLLNLSSFDAATFMEQLAESSFEPAVIGFSWDPQSAVIAEAAFDGFMFVGEFFDAANPENEWAELFVNEYRSGSGGRDPNQYAASAYEDTFLLWQLARRMRANGEDNFDYGPGYLKALEQEPSFPSLYGAGGATGTNTLDLRTHSPSRRTMGVFEVKAGEAPTRFATFNVGGSGYTEA